MVHTAWLTDFGRVYENHRVAADNHASWALASDRLGFCHREVEDLLEDGPVARGQFIKLRYDDLEGQVEQREDLTTTGRGGS
jgi:hypothetical protein